MGRTKKNRIALIVFTAVTLLLIAFIFLHSSMNDDESNGESLAALSFLTVIFEKLGIPLELTNHTVRKAAHFLEFALLGVLVTLTLYTYIKKPLNNMTSVLFICLATAVCDETIQLYVPGRAGMVQDVLLDFFGSLIGVLIVSAILFTIIFARNKKSR